MASRVLSSTERRTHRRGRRGRQARITARRTTGHCFALPSAIASDTQLTAHDKLTWLILDALGGQNVLQADIAKLCGCSVAGVRKAILSLVVRGRLMVLSRCGARTNCYLTLNPDVMEAARADNAWTEIKEAVPPDDYEGLLRHEGYFRLRFEWKWGREPTRKEVRDWRAKLPAVKKGGV